MPQIQHILTPVSRSHPWKGADLPQQARSHYVAMGDGTGIWVAQGAGQIKFTGSHAVVAPAAFTLFDPTADYTAEAIADYVTEGDNELTWDGSANSYMQLVWAITLSHNGGGVREISAVCAPTTGVAGYEKLVQDVEAGNNNSTVLSGKTIKKIAHGVAFGIWVRVPAGNLTVTKARLSMMRVN